MGRQRRAVERLKAWLLGTDPYVGRRYIQDFHQEFRAFRARISSEGLIEACARADVVFVGDYHALPSCQTFAAELVESLAGQERPLVLFLEMIFARHQRALDQFLAGRVDEEELRRSIHYDRDWGYPWAGYGRLLRAARDRGVAVVAADAPPRSGLRMIRRRDRHAAAKIRERLVSQPEARAMVLFGESHMARGHLPREVGADLARYGLKRSMVVVVQNVEEIYWKLAREGREDTGAVQVDATRYCVFNASPLAKYEAYRQTLLGWSQQEDESPDFGPSVHHLIDLLVSYLGLDRYRTLAPAPDGGLSPLVDLYPEVVARRDRRRRAEMRPRRRRARPGMVYRPRSNRIDVYTFSLAAAGEAASRFLLTALRGRAGRDHAKRGGRPSPGEGSRRNDPRGGSGLQRLPHAMAILDEAFVSFSVCYLDPGRPPDRRWTVERGRPRRGAPPRQLATSFSELLAAAKGPKQKGRAVRSRTCADKAGRLGERLGSSIYARLRKRSEGRGTREWLLAVSRLAGDGPGNVGAEVTRLLQEAAVQVGGSVSISKRS